MVGRFRFVTSALSLFLSPLRPQETVNDKIDQMLALSAEKEKFLNLSVGAWLLFRKIFGKHGNCVKQAITPKAIDCIVSKYAQLSGINKRITPHSFRTSFATHALDKGADLKTVSELLGHASILSTQPYLRSNIERNQKAI